MNDVHLLPLFIFGTFVICSFAVAVIISLIIQKQRQIRNRLARQQMAFDYSQSLLNTRIEVQETTLNMLSRELHDNIAQGLTGCFMQISAADGYMEQGGGKALIGEAKAGIKDVIRDLRLLSHSLATGMVEKRELDEAIQAELTRIRAFSGIACALEPGTVQELMPEQKLFLFRIVQEALQNILKHAAAQHIRITLESTDEHFQILIRDDGKGFDTTAVPDGGSLGLISMKERVGLLRGTIHIDSAPGKGTTIDIRIPINIPDGKDTNSYS